MKVTLRDTEEEADKVCSKVQRTFDNAVGKLPAVPYFNTKTNLSALNYAQDFGTFFFLDFQSGLQSGKSNCPMCNTLISASLCEQPDDYETGSDTESDEEDDFEVVL